MQQATDPAGDHMPRHLACAQSVAVASLRPMIAHSRALIGEAEKEPPFIGRHRVLISEWSPALSALEALITKVAALESLLEGTLHGRSTDTVLVQVLYAFTVHAQVDVEVTHAHITTVTQCGVVTTASNGFGLHLRQLQSVYLTPLVSLASICDRMLSREFIMGILRIRLVPEQRALIVLWK